MSSEALREAFDWLEAIASADPKLVRPSGLAAALLAEVARLEQELRDARQGWDGWQAQCLAAEAALAVAREREQRAHAGYLREIDAIAERYERRAEIMREALHDIAWDAPPGRSDIRHIARRALAALVDEPAAGPETDSGDARDAVVSSGGES